MADLITWSGHGGISFFAKSSEIRGVKDITISTGAETEDKTKGGEKYIKKKNKGSYQLTLSAVLNAALGVDVKTVAMQITEAARCGDSGYFYTAGTKLFPCKFMCTDAKINSLTMTGSGAWKSCEISMTLKQCGKYGSISSGGKKSKKSKSKKRSGTRKSKSSGKSSGKSTTKKKVSSASNTSEVDAISGAHYSVNMTNTAKSASKKARQTLTTRKVAVPSKLMLSKMDRVR